MRIWLDRLRDLGLVSEHVHAAILVEDEDKFERLLRVGRMLDARVQKFTAIAGVDFCADLVRKRTESLSTSTYDVRMVPRVGSNVHAFRLHGLPLDQLVAYVTARLSDPELYTIYVAEHYHALFSGTIISKDSGLLVELVEGQHLHLTQAGTKPIYGARWLGYRMAYDCENASIRQRMWRAVRMIAMTSTPVISPLNPPCFLEGYFEFIYTDDGLLILTDYSHRLLLETDAARQANW